MHQPIDLEALCTERGLRITEQRRVIARVLSEAEDHPDVEALHARAAAIDPKISIATVYRTVRYTVAIEILGSISAALACSASTSGWSSASDRTRAMTRRCSVILSPRSAQSASRSIGWCKASPVRKRKAPGHYGSGRTLFQPRVRVWTRFTRRLSCAVRASGPACGRGRSAWPARAASRHSRARPSDSRPAAPSACDIRPASGRDRSSGAA